VAVALVVCLGFALRLQAARSWNASRPDASLEFSILAYCTLLHAVTHAEERLSEPLHPLLLVIVAGAALRVWSGGFRRVHSAS